MMRKVVHALLILFALSPLLLLGLMLWRGQIVPAFFFYCLMWWVLYQLYKRTRAASSTESEGDA